MSCPRKIVDGEHRPEQINGTAGISGGVNVQAAAGAHLPASAGTDAKADWRAGNDTLKNSFAALVEADGEDAIRAARRGWEDAMQTRPDRAPRPATGFPSHMEIVLRDMEELHHRGQLPPTNAKVWDLLCDRDVARQGSTRDALASGTIRNNLKGALRDLRAGRPLRALLDYRPKKRR